MVNSESARRALRGEQEMDAERTAALRDVDKGLDELR